MLIKKNKYFICMQSVIFELLLSHKGITFYAHPSPIYTQILEGLVYAASF